ncbi:MAG: hypothetical protein IPG70_02640 [Moraxellaceae bacterium]|nr:hypothetical protein [Moraxellaceae bacterium]
MSVFSQPSSVVRYSSFFFIALALSACNKTCKAQHHKVASNATTPEVAVITVKTQNTPVHFEYTAQVAASKEAEIRARVSGILLKKKRYRKAKPLGAGQPLFVLDSANYEAVVNNLGGAACQYAGAFKSGRA